MTVIVIVNIDVDLNLIVREVAIADICKSLEEGFQLFQHCCYLALTISIYVKRVDRRHNAIQFHTTLRHISTFVGVLNELNCLVTLQILFVDDSIKLASLFTVHIYTPCSIHLAVWCQLLYELLYQLFLITKVGATVNSLADAHSDFAILLVTLSVLLDKEEDEVNIHLDLFHKFHFEYQIIADVFLVLLLVDNLLTYVQINAGNYSYNKKYNKK